MKNYFSYWEILLRRIKAISHDMKSVFMGSFVFKGSSWCVLTRDPTFVDSVALRTPERKNNISL